MEDYTVLVLLSCFLTPAGDWKDVVLLLLTRFTDIKIKGFDIDVANPFLATRDPPVPPRLEQD